MTGLETSLIAGLFTEQTAAKHLLAAYPLANLAVVFLHNGYVEVSATAFRLFTVLAVALLTVFFWRLPAKTWPRYTKKEDALAAPKPLLAGILTLTGLSCFANLFGTAVAESVPHGVAVLYLSASVCALAVFLLWKRWGVMPLTSCSALAALSVMGFVAAIAAQYIPGLFYAAAVLLGAGVTVCWLNPFFGLLIARRFPSKWIVPAILGVAFLSTLIQIALLEALRESPTILYLVYLVVAVAMTILYFQLKPYLQFLYRGRTLQDISEAYSAGEDAEPSADAEAPTPDETAESRAAAPVESDPAESEALRRLKRAAFEPLSPRECQVGEMTMLGVRRGIIAAKLGIEASTVDYYRSCVYNKFGVSNRDELVARVEELNQALDEKKGRDYHE
jgi:DNA-binding CsgD family transcriptional regulator